MRRAIILLTAVLFAASGLLPSCKKKSTQHSPAAEPRRFDPKIDGIAVRPLKTIDPQLAKDILKNEKAFRAGESIVPAPQLDPKLTSASPAESAAAASTSAPLRPKSSGTPPATSTEPAYDDFDDANDIF